MFRRLEATNVAKFNTTTIDTTLGDLISAIRDAAQEAHVDESEMNEYMEIVLYDLLLKYAA